MRSVYVPYKDGEFQRTDLEIRQLRGYVAAMGAVVFDMLAVKLQLTDAELSQFKALTYADKHDNDGDQLWTKDRVRLDRAVGTFILAGIESGRFPSMETWANQRRVVCPLCGATPDHSSGFTFPEGLDRHFQGWGNMHQCQMMTALWSMHEYAKTAFERTGQSGGWY